MIWRWEKNCQQKVLLTNIENGSFHVVKGRERLQNAQKRKVRAKQAQLLLFVVKYANLSCSCRHLKLPNFLPSPE